MNEYVLTFYDWRSLLWDHIKSLISVRAHHWRTQSLGPKKSSAKLAARSSFIGVTHKMRHLAVLAKPIEALSKTDSYC